MPTNRQQNKNPLFGFGGGVSGSTKRSKAAFERVREAGEDFKAASSKSAAEKMARVVGGGAKVVKRGGSWGVVVSNPTFDGQHLSGKNITKAKAIIRRVESQHPGSPDDVWIDNIVHDMGITRGAAREVIEWIERGGGTPGIKFTTEVAYSIGSKDFKDLKEAKKYAQEYADEEERSITIVKETRKYPKRGTRFDRNAETTEEEIVVHPKKGNPEPAAASAFESFHGYQSGEVIEFPQDLHYHENVWACGVLIEFKVETIFGKCADITFADPGDMDLENNPVLWPWRSKKDWVHYRTFKDEISGQKVLGALADKDVDAVLDRVRTRLLPTSRYKYEIWVKRESLPLLTSKRAASSRTADKQLASMRQRLAEMNPSYKESDIVYENGKFWVLRKGPGHFEVYESGITHSTRRGIFGGSSGERADYFLKRAKDRADELAGKATKNPRKDPGALKRGQKFSFKSVEYKVLQFVPTYPEDGNLTYLVEQISTGIKKEAWVYAADRGANYAGKVFEVSPVTQLGAYENRGVQRNPPNYDTSQFNYRNLTSTALSGESTLSKKVKTFIASYPNAYYWDMRPLSGGSQMVTLFNKKKELVAQQETAHMKANPKGPFTEASNMVGGVVRGASRPLDQFGHTASEVTGYLDGLLGKTIKGSKKPRRSNPGGELSDITYLTANESGKQLYLTGGDQCVDLKGLGITGPAAEKDLVEIGLLTHVTYHTRKIFDGKSEEFDYIHKMGEKGGHPPSLHYDRMNKRLLVSGGTYVINKPLLGTSPGIEH